MKEATSTATAPTKLTQSQWRAQGLKVVYSKIQKAMQNGYFIPIINIYTLSYTFRYYKLTKIFGIQ